MATSTTISTRVEDIEGEERTMPLLSSGGEGGGGEGEKRSSTFYSALSSTTKAIIGTGVIAVPYAIVEVGYVVGILGLFSVAFLSAYSMKTLIRCSHVVREAAGRDRRKAAAENVDETKQTNADTVDSNHGISRALVKSGEESEEGAEHGEGEGTIRKIAEFCYGARGVLFADFVLLSAQIGAAVAFAEFIVSAWSDVLNAHRVYPAIIISPVLVLLSLLKSTASLEPVAFVGNFIFLFSFIAVIVFGFGTTHGDFQSVEAENVSASSLSSFLGLTLFALAAQSECMSIEKFLPKKVQLQYCRVLDISLTIAVCIYIAIGMLCYAFFGAHTKDVIFDNIVCTGDAAAVAADDDEAFLRCRSFDKPTVSAIRNVVKIGMACMISVNYPFTLEGAVHTIEELYLGRPAKRCFGLFVEPIACVGRVVCVGTTLLVAVLVPDFSFLVGLCGTFSSGLLAFVLPPLFSLKLNDPRKGGDRLAALGHGLVLVGGLVFSLVATAFLIKGKIA